MLKISMKYGVAEVAVEGDKADAEYVLTTFWSPLWQALVTTDEAASTGTAEAERQPAKGPIKARRKAAPREPKAAADSDGEVELANSVKTHAEFPRITTKIILRKAEWLRKCQMVILVANRPLHSGAVSRVLTALGVKNSLPTISKTLSANKGQFLTTGTNPETYNLTAAAKAEFVRWLSETDVES